MDWHAIWTGLQQAMLPFNVLAMLLGTGAGIFLGAQPDLTPSLGMALLLPLAALVPPETALIVLGSLYCGALFGGSIHAILSRVPGSQAHGMTVLDGYRLAEAGRSGHALFIACIASAVGGLLSSFSLFLLTPRLARVLGLLEGADYFWFCVFACAAVVCLSSRSLTKGALACLFGLFLGLIGPHPLTGVPRFDFGLKIFSHGLPPAPFLIGVFAWGPMLYMLDSKPHRRAKLFSLSGSYIPRGCSPVPLFLSTLYAWLIGNLVGLLPGTGASVGARLAYLQAKRHSENRRLFGRGSLEGVAAAEAGNNAATGGALTPSLGLGIPGDAPTAVILGGLLMLGLEPGPQLFARYSTLTYTFFVGFLLSHIVLVILGLTAANLFARASRIRQKLLVPGVLILGLLMVYVVRFEIGDCLLLPVFGLVGYASKRLHFNPTALATGWLLSAIGQRGLASLSASGEGVTGLFSSTLSWIFLLLTVAVMLLPYIFQNFRREIVKSLGLEANLSD